MSFSPNIVFGRFSSPTIEVLLSNEIFVFGSNLSGIHGGGAAAAARRYFGAANGVGIGLTGQCYAIPTVDKNISRTLAVEEIKPHVDKFLICALQYPNLNFLLTEVGCGIAGHSHRDIAPLFRLGLSLPNLFMPQKFVMFLENQN